MNDASGPVGADPYRDPMKSTSGPAVQPPPHACAVCGHVLSYVGSQASEVVEWIHGGPDDADHPVVAVLVEEIHANVRCDFCLADRAPWVLPVQPYEVGPGQWNSGNWAVCDDCHRELSRDRWSALVTRAKAAMDARGNVAPRRIFEDLYARVRANVIGPVRRRRCEQL